MEQVELGAEMEMRLCNIQHSILWRQMRKLTKEQSVLVLLQTWPRKAISPAEVVDRNLEAGSAHSASR